MVSTLYRRARRTRPRVPPARTRHEGLQGLCRTSCGSPENRNGCDCLLRLIDVYLPVRVAMVGLPPVTLDRDPGTELLQYPDPHGQRLRRVNGSASMELLDVPACAHPDLQAGLQFRALPAQRVRQLIAYRPAFKTGQVTIGLVLGEQG